MEVYGWGHLPPDSVGTELGYSVIMLFPPLPGRKRKRNPSLQRQAQPEICPHPLISCSQIRMGFAEVQGAGGWWGEGRESFDGQGPGERGERGREKERVCVCVRECVSEASGRGEMG